MNGAQQWRWRDYYLQSGGDFAVFWKRLLSEERKVLILLGHGFDPRMCSCATAILDVGGGGLRDALVIEYDEGAASHSKAYEAQREENGKRLNALFEKRGEISRRPIQMLSSDGRRIGSRSVTNQFASIEEFRQYTDVVLDVSALPRGLYFPLLSKLLALFDRQPANGRNPNLHVVVAHSPEVDGKIVDEGVEENAVFLHGFAAASFEREATREQPRIWIPLLGHAQLVQLERVYELVAPDEVCPLLPSPARNPRESDDLILEYREFLFDRLRVEPQNIIYAAESNPFEVYRQLMRSISHYRLALEPLGGCKAVLSALSSKLLSLGAALAAYELCHSPGVEDPIDVGVAHVDTQGYRVSEKCDSGPDVEHYSLWLTGECYDDQ